MDIVVIDRRHHSPLHVGNAPAWKEHEQIGAFAAAKCFDCSAARISGRRNHDGRAFTACREHLVHEVAEKLHRQVLEGERRPVKQLQEEIVRSVLSKRRHRGVTERAIGLASAPPACG